MAGRFEGVSDEQWEAIRPYFPPQNPAKRGRGKPPTDPRLVLNSILYILITGSRWCDLPIEDAFAPRSTSHRWLQRWQDEGRWEKFKQAMLVMGQLHGQIDWEASSVDGSFSPR